MPVHYENNVTRVSFIQHILAIPKTSGASGDEFEAKHIDIQPRTIDLSDY